MLRCCAGICGGGIDDTPVRTPPGSLEQGVKKPALRLDEPDVLEASSEMLMQRFEMTVAPPDADPPVALVSKNFRTNVQRLLVLVPTAGAPLGAWDTDLPDGRGAALPLLQWAEANDYAFALFSSVALAASPAEAWERILSGSPTRHVVVLAAAVGALELVQAGLLPVHELLFARIHCVAMPFEGMLPPTVSPAIASSLPAKPKALRAHLRGIQTNWPAEWADLEPRLMRQRLFEMLKEKEDFWAQMEASKYMDLRSLKENDIPGLKRLGVDQRVNRLNRDRDTDELSRLIDKHQTDVRGADEDEDEPGID